MHALGGRALVAEALGAGENVDLAAVIGCPLGLAGLSKTQCAAVMMCHSSRIDPPQYCPSSSTAGRPARTSAT